RLLHFDPQPGGGKQIYHELAQQWLVSGEENRGLFAVIAQLDPDFFRRAVGYERLGANDFSFVAKAFDSDTGRLDRPFVRTRNDQRRLDSRATSGLDDIRDFLFPFIGKRAFGIGAPRLCIFRMAVPQEIKLLQADRLTALPVPLTGFNCNDRMRRWSSLKIASGVLLASIGVKA